MCGLLVLEGVRWTADDCLRRVGTADEDEMWRTVAGLLSLVELAVAELETAVEFVGAICA